MFSVGVAKAFNWKIALFVFIILVTAFETGSRLFQKLFNHNVEKSYSGDVVGVDCPSRDHAQIKRLDKLRSEVSNREGDRIA
jgi:hypothetical protein